MLHRNLECLIANICCKNIILYLHNYLIVFSFYMLALMLNKVLLYQLVLLFYTIIKARLKSATRNKFVRTFAEKKNVHKNRNQKKESLMDKTLTKVTFIFIKIKVTRNGTNVFIDHHRQYGELELVFKSHLPLPLYLSA